MGVAALAQAASGPVSTMLELGALEADPWEREAFFAVRG